MQLIIDTNQADPIRLSYKVLGAKQRPRLVIPHRVWTELLIGNEGDKRRRALAKFPLVFGMDKAAIFDELAQRSVDQIRTFSPIYADGSDEHELLLKTFVHSTNAQRARAVECRADGSDYRQQLPQKLNAVRKKIRDRHNATKSRGDILESRTWHPIRDEQDLFLNEDAPYRRWLIKEVSTDADGNSRPIVAPSGNAMFDAVWNNHVLRRFLRLQAAIRLGYAQVWEDPKLNRQVRMKCDDDPDMELVLYARDGDTILTADNITEYRIRLIDAEKCLTITTWGDWLAAQSQAAD